jgi:NAD(P)-dependent dehydrogenase (short-subunit alcohol dehydrogenase family)/acyl carrier protein
LARVFVGGVHVDWARVLPAGNRVELPTYAFQHDRYWPEGTLAMPRPSLAAPAGRAGDDSRFWTAVQDGDLASLALDADRPLRELLPELAAWRLREQDRSVTAGWRYRVGWVPVAERDAAALSGRWLVVSGSAGASPAAEIGRILAARGAEVRLVLVPAGTADRTALAALVDEPAAGGSGPLAGVLSLLALEEDPLPGLAAVPHGLAATLALVQALGDLGLDAPLWLATRGAVATGPRETLTNPVQAQVGGLGRVVALEHPDRWGGLIDLPATLDERSAARLVAVLAGRGEEEIAIRAAGVLGRRITHAPQPQADRTWKPRGGALITGGTGAIGGRVARRLAAEGTPRLLLTSRSGPSAAGAADLAASSAHAGARVDIVACDAGDRAELTGLLAWVAGDITAVMHTAGVLDDGVLERQSPERLATVLQAKAVSAALLDELTADLDLEAFVLFSSSAATLGSPGQGNYAAANAYLDALAESRRARGRAALSVAWGLWGGGGLGDSTETIRTRMHRMPMPAMDPELGVRALFEALQAGDTALTVMDVDWAQLASGPGSAGLRSRPLVRDLPEVRQLLAAPAAATGEPALDEDELSRRLSGLPRAEQERVLTDIVRAEAAVVLGHTSPDAVQPASTFKKLGFDSLSGVELRNRLTTATGLRLPATLVFDHPTPQEFAAWLLTELAPQEKVAVPILDELTRFEAVVLGKPADDAVRDEVSERLRRLLDAMAASSAEKSRSEREAELGAATDDELFALVEELE